MSTDSSDGTRAAVIAGALIGVLGVGWFVMSHFVIHNTSADAVGEAVGVVLALLIVASCIGAVLSSRRSHR
jgi:hypothetical protein